MKTTNQILILMAVLSLMACGQDQKIEHLITVISDTPNSTNSVTVHTIKLYVNTAKIHKDSVDKYANFRQPYYISNKDYTTLVRKGDLVIWYGVSITDTLDVVNINSINHHGGPRFFDKNVLNGNGGDNEVVAGVITKGPVTENDILLDKEKYILKFSVKKKGDPKTYKFEIDPVLKGYE